MAKKTTTDSKPTFIDLFSGCGGLSLGLMEAGWQGLFAIEKTPDAFLTLKHNLIESTRFSFNWPEWLPQENMEVQCLLKDYRSELVKLKGKIDLIAGGPPCQGFSNAGKRNPNDPRNKLAEQYIEVVKIVEPKYLLLENVRGFNSKFEKSGNPDDIPYSQIVKKKLESLGYGVDYRIVICADWGVPQRRPRFIMIAKKGAVSKEFTPFKDVEKFRVDHLNRLGLNPEKPVSVYDAIGDLEISGKELKPNQEPNGRRFSEIEYVEPTSMNSYLKILRNGMEKEAPNSLRLPRHSAIVANRFKLIIENCPKGTSVPEEYKALLDTKKRTLTLLAPDKPSATVTTLPDDIVHYKEPRILTVRENARLQSFPDWFAFQGVYTTGGERRKYTCPRYTQVGNAVPPMLSRALGEFIKTLQ
jgi:DNA (cytosine-5)-methyltransferase 1